MYASKSASVARLIVDRLHGDSSVRHRIISGGRRFSPRLVGGRGGVESVSSACTASIYSFVVGDRLRKTVVDLTIVGKFEV